MEFGIWNFEIYINGGLAQLARAPALHAGGHRFDSDILHKKMSTDIFRLNKRLKKVFRQTQESGRKDDKVTTL